MSREDMYAFEKAMQANPFLEDAVEGFREANISKAEKDITAIKAALLPEKESAKIVPFYIAYKTWFSAAAAIIVIGTIGAVTFAILQPSNNNQQVAIVAPASEKPRAFTDTTHSINNSQIVANQKATPTIASSKKQPIIVADREVSAALARQETVSSLQGDKVKADSLYTSSSVAKLSEKEMKSPQPISIEQALRGRVAGVAVTQKDNRDNQAITIRGASSFNAKQQPLYIVDGKPYDSLPSFASVNNIKSIDILKDSATKIYGSSAKNGVVLVTTNQYFADQEAKRNAFLKESIAKKEAAKSLHKSNATPAKDSTQTAKNTLDEVIVVGYGTAKRKDVTGSVAKVAIDPLDSLMPVGGWQYYSKYMNQKIGFIGDTTGKNSLAIRDRTGNKLDDIDIEFSVDKDGSPYNVKVITDVDSTQAKTIANAVVEGPKWISRKKKNKAKIPLKTP
jgi:TonB-dependent SusC/RagA subfamily outer membrane receptor